MAALQAAELSEAQASNLFWVNFTLGTFLALVLTGSSPVLAHVFHDARLTHLTPVIALVVVLTSAEAQFRVRLARDFRFGVLMATDVLAEAVGLAVAIIIAAKFHSYWALAVDVGLSEFVRLLSRALASHWRPGLFRRHVGTRSLLKFGAYLSAAQLLTYAATNTDTYTVGYRFGSYSLGIYNRAFQLISVPANQLLAPLANVSVPVLVRAKPGSPQFESLVVQSIFAVAGPIICALAVAAGASNAIVAVFLGGQWKPSAPVLALLCVAASAQTLTNVGYWSFLASGRSRELLRYQLLTKPILVVSILLGSVGRLKGVAIGFSIGATLGWPICVGWLRRMQVWRNVPALKTSLVLAAAAVMAYLTTRSVISLSGLTGIGAIAGGGAAGCGVYLLSLSLTRFGRQHVTDFATTVRTHVVGRVV